MTIAEALRAATERLRPATPTPRLDAELLLAHVLTVSRTYLLTALREPLPPDAQDRFAALTARRLNLEPVAYLTGHREFYGLDFLVTPDTLVPRPETELLVDLALGWIAAHGPTQRPIHVADVGTGTGCIAVAVAVHAPQVQIAALDISVAALAVAQQNVARHGVAARVTLAASDLFSAAPGPFDLILSNPPYTRLAAIDPGVRQHEPHLALDGGPDGLAVYRTLIPQAAARLVPGGVVMLEIGADQGAAVAALLAAALPGAAVRVLQDLAGLDRVVVAES